MTAVALAPVAVDLEAVYATVNRRYFMNKLPYAELSYGELAAGEWGGYFHRPPAIVISSHLRYRPKSVRYALIHESLHYWIDLNYPIKAQRGGHSSPAWLAEAQRISWLMGQPVNAWKAHPEIFPIWEAA